MKENNYRPLPDGLYIGISEIDGNGLFTRKELKEGDEMGITHIRYNSDDFHSNYIRTPLGGFYNHKMHTFLLTQRHLEFLFFQDSCIEKMPTHLYTTLET